MAATSNGNEKKRKKEGKKGWQQKNEGHAVTKGVATKKVGIGKGAKVGGPGTKAQRKAQMKAQARRGG